MSGVIDEHGQQWEHCHGCGGWVKLEDLGHMMQNPKHPYGLDLCVKCVDTGIRIGAIEFNEIVPAESWKVTRS